MKRINDRKGFTLLELMIVISVIIILSASVIYGFNRVNYNSKMNIVKGNQQQIIAGMERYTKITGLFPQGVSEQEIQADFENVLKNTAYFTSVPINPFYEGDDPAKGWIWVPETLEVIPVLIQHINPE